MKIMTRVIPWLLLVAGVAVIVFAGVSGVRSFVSALQPAAEWNSPGTQTVTLDEGTWVVYQAGAISPRTGSSEEWTIDWQDITVTGPSGPVATSCVYCSGSETLGVGAVTYRGVVRFAAETAGDYSITTETSGSRLAVAQSAFRTVSDTFSALMWMGVGGLLIAAGMVWLVVLLVQYLSRPKGPRPADGQAVPTGGAYPGPPPMDPRLAPPTPVGQQPQAQVPQPGYPPPAGQQPTIPSGNSPTPPGSAPTPPGSSPTPRGSTGLPSQGAVPPSDLTASSPTPGPGSAPDPPPPGNQSS